MNRPAIAPTRLIPSGWPVPVLQNDLCGTPVLSLGQMGRHDGFLPTTTLIRSNALPFFIVLQCLDVLTTLVFLSKGMDEGNPLVHWAISNAHAPWIALVVTKSIAALIGQYCYRSGRMTLLRRANAVYSLVVGWNLFAIGAALFAH
jgi:hypothetical protein